MSEIRCPKASCVYSFNPADIEMVCADYNRQDIFDKFEYFLLSTEVEKDPRLCWCPQPDCKGFAKRMKHGQEETINCLKCGYEFCGKCKAASH